MKSTKDKPIVVVFKWTPAVPDGQWKLLKALGLTDEEIEREHMRKTHIDAINELAGLVEAGEYVDVIVEDKPTDSFIQTYFTDSIIKPIF